MNKWTQSTGKHLSTGCDYPDSPCGFPEPLTYELKEVTCPECIKILIKNAQKTLKLFGDRD